MLSPSNFNTYAFTFMWKSWNTALTPQWWIRKKNRCSKSGNFISFMLTYRSESSSWIWLSKTNRIFPCPTAEWITWLSTMKIKTNSSLSVSKSVSVCQPYISQNYLRANVVVLVVCLFWYVRTRSIFHSTADVLLQTL